MNKGHFRNVQQKAEDAAKPVETYAAAPRGKPDLDKYKGTFFLPRPVYQVIREVMNLRNTSLQQILLEALDMWLVSKEVGRPPIAEIMKAAEREAKKAEDKRV